MLPTGLGGHHEGRGHHVCGRGGSLHETVTLRGGATPDEAGDSCPEREDKGGEYTRQGEGGSGEWRNITPLRRGLTHPRGKKVVRWSEKLEEVGEYSDDEEVVELTSETGDTGGRGP